MIEINKTHHLQEVMCTINGILVRCVIWTLTDRDDVFYLLHNDENSELWGISPYSIEKTLWQKYGNNSWQVPFNNHSQESVVIISFINCKIIHELW